MASTYRAVEISSPGVFSLVERKVAVPGAGQVRIRVEACGVCHSDAATVEAQFPNLSYPRVPGHEVIGRIEEVGPGVTAWKVDQRVGVGFFGGEVTTFNALRNAARAGDTVAIQGVGGLGHLGVQFARKMGLRTVAIGGGPDKEHLAQKFGAHIYIDAKAQDAAAALQKLGGADVILATAPSGAAIGSLLPGLKTRGKLVVVGVSGDAIPVNGVPLIFGGRSVVGSLTGRAIETQDTLDFSVLTDVRPMIETLPLAKAEEAYKRMMDGKARFRRQNGAQTERPRGRLG